MKIAFQSALPRSLVIQYVLLLMLVTSALSAAPMKFFPVDLKQPDGAVIHVFLSGDEYYNWAHDADNFTIVQDPKSGYYVYADLIDGVLQSTEYIVGRVDPKLTRLTRGLNISPDMMTAKRNSRLARTPNDMGDAPKTGTINNLVVYIRFSGESEFTDLRSSYDNMFNNSSTGYNSMQNYFKEASYNTLTISTTFYPTTAGTTVISYLDSNPRGYYQPYNASTNPIGYPNDDSSRLREHRLLQSAIAYVATQVPAGLTIDSDNDGKVDNVCFVVYGAPGAWADLLWPHRWVLYSYNVMLNGKRVYDYNFQLQTSLASSGVGVLCHEMFHSLGSPDLYHYSYDGFSPVGYWDVMEYDQNPPQHMSAYMKYRYGTWISSIPTITAGTYTLNQLTSSTGNCYKIVSPNSATEYFVLEYRKKTGTFENSLPGSGLLIYRVNSTYDGQGNSSGPPDELYVYRPGGTTSANGTVNSANFSSDVGRTAFNDATNPTPFLSSGSSGGISISSIGSAGTTISFTLAGSTSPPVADFIASNTEIKTGDTVSFTDKSSNTPTSWAWSFQGGTPSSSTTQNPASVIYSAAGSYDVSLTATNVNGSNQMTKTAYMTVGNYRCYNFETSQFPPYNWAVTYTGTNYWSRSTAASSYGTGSASAKFNFYSASSGTTQYLASETFTATNAGDSLRFDYAYATYTTQVDQLVIEYSTNGGTNYSTLLTMPGGTTVGSGMVTASATNSVFVPTAVQWLTKKIALPAGANKIRFKAVSAYGNNLYLDKIYVQSSGKSLAIISPNGGQSYTGGTTQNITWSSSNISTIKIELTTDNGSSWSTVNGSVAAAGGTYPWTVPNTPSTQCKVRITDNSNSLFTSTSTSVFTILATPPSVTVLTPNGGGIYKAGTAQNITWNYYSVTNLKLEYTTNAGASWTTIAGSVAASSGTYAWTIPAVQSSQCKVRISDASNASIWDTSASVFTINLPVVSLTSPVGGEVWSIGASQAITWSAANISTLKLEYTTNNGSSWLFIDSTTSVSGGTYSWTIPFTPSSNCKVRVSDNSDNSFTDISDSAFTILATNPPNQFEIKVSSLIPWLTGGYGVEFDGTYFYVSQYNSTSGKIFRLNKSGTTIDSGLVSGMTSGFYDLAWDGQYLYGTNNTNTIYKIDRTTWTIAGTITAPGTVRGIAYNKANDAFWVSNLNTALNLVSRSGAALRSIPTTTHKVSGMTGLAYDTLSSLTPFIWAFTGGGPAYPKLLVRINANTGARVDTIVMTSYFPTAIAGGLFITNQYEPGTITIGGMGQISPYKIFGHKLTPIPAVAVSSPNGGENWTAGSQHTVAWSSMNIDYVKIEFSIDNGISWNSIISSVSASPASYQWTVSTTPSALCRIRVSDASNSAVFDISDTTFTIAPSVFQLNLQAAVAGLYNGVTHIGDTLIVELRQTTAPFSLVGLGRNSFTAASASILFNGLTNAEQYYLVVRHRNAVETWSAQPVSFSSNALNYNFTDTSAKAYGNNLIKRGNIWCLYSGDINQDGIVDFSDMALTDNASYQYMSGYCNEDVTGDGFVDFSDLAEVENSASHYVGAVTPLTGVLVRPTQQIKLKSTPYLMP